MTSTTPRFCTRKQDEEGNVIDCDEAYVQMFGYSAEELIGKPTFERVHPDDQARVIEGWVAAVASGRAQMFRVRHEAQGRQLAVGGHDAAQPARGSRAEAACWRSASTYPRR